MRKESDLIFLAEPDEESGGDWGVQGMLANQRQKIDAEFALNEGGRVVLEKGRVGESFRRYGATRLFSPFAMNVSARARALLGTRAPAADALLTGMEMTERVLEPLAVAPPSNHVFKSFQSARLL